MMRRRSPRVGPYRLGRLLGGGGGGVYEAWDARRARKVAVKLEALARSPRERRRCVARARALAGFRHPHAVATLDVVEAGAHLAVVMEYVPGADLQALLDGARLDLRTLLRYGIELCAALDAMHRWGFVHRDVKPGNVLVDRAGAARLADFGIAVPLRPAAQRRHARLARSGAYYAMSPEHAIGALVDQRADVFALGLLLYRGATGRHPFPWRGDPRDYLRRLLTEDHPDPARLRPGLPAGLAAAIDTALCKDPRGRFGSAMAMRRALWQVSDSLPGGARAARPCPP